MPHVVHSVTRRFRFSAAHHLPDHEGACAVNHGHNWQAFVTVEGSLHRDGSQQGMVVEIDRLKALWDAVFDHLDHSDLNATIPAPFQPATTEHVAAYLLHELRARGGLNVTQVRVVETENNEATARWVP